MVCRIFEAILRAHEPELAQEAVGALRERARVRLQPLELPEAAAQQVLEGAEELLVELGHEEMRVGIGELVAHVGGKAKRGAVIVSFKPE